MATAMAGHLAAAVDSLRFQPTAKRIQVRLGGTLLCDTTDAVLVWEPRRVVPTYAVPTDALRARLLPAQARAAPDPPPRVLLPDVAGVHLGAGRTFTVRAGEHVAEAAAFVPDDPDLAGYAVLEFAPFAWTEEAEPVIGHPHDPFSRIDILPSDRHVVVSSDGVVLADSHRPVALFETQLPVRWYLPPEDVRQDPLVPSETRSVCAYKGVASYFSLASGARADVAWTYAEPLPEASRVQGLICFFAERADHTVDGAPQDRPSTPWSGRT